MKQLFGSDLAGFIKERQSQQVRQLKQQYAIVPKLAIVSCSDNPTIKTYVTLKKLYGADIGVQVQEYAINQSEIAQVLQKLNVDSLIHGIIVQLPLADVSDTKNVLSMVAVQKDVDGLAPNTAYDAATPLAIHWLLSGYNIDLAGKKICIVGKGTLVGSPLTTMWEKSGLHPIVIEEQTPNKNEIIQSADIIVTAVGKPGIIKSEIVKNGAVVVDAGVTSEKGVLKGDVADDVYERGDITITPKKGGVGPLTVCALFDNVIRAAYESVKK